VLVIVRRKTKRRLTLGLKVLVAIFVISLVCSHVYNMYSGKNVIREGWLRDDKPSGNPLRVQNGYGAVEKKNPDILDQFVVKLRDLYQKDQ
jgi:hypothetical protein